MKLKWFFVIGVVMLLVACQRELSLENAQPSAGSLVKDASGNCALVTAGGTYVVSKPLNDSNFITVSVDVTTPGPYTISTDTINGYSFSATGAFSGAGVTSVRLPGKGTPLLLAQNNFTVYYLNSVCAATIQIERNPLSPAAYTLSGAPGNCVNTVLQGSFISGYAVDTQKVLVEVNVTAIGVYSLSTTTVNGYRFFGSGTFTATGVQNVILTATGTPLVAGVNAFSIAGAAAGCSFNVTVNNTLTVAGTDYFPLTKPSFWVYDRDNFATDSIKRTVVDNVTQNGKAYIKMDEFFPFAGGPLYFRKEGSDYYEYGRVDKYTNSFQYSPAVNDDILFLKENLTTGASWVTPEYTGTASFGQTIRLRYRFQCVDANAAATINGTTFGNVYKILMLPEIASVGNNWGSTTESYEFYYAKGVGLIYTTKTLLGYSQYRQMLRRWMVY